MGKLAGFHRLRVTELYSVTTITTKNSEIKIFKVWKWKLHKIRELILPS
jgi:hypothetical protein